MSDTEQLIQAIVELTKVVDKLLTSNINHEIRIKELEAKNV